MVSKISEQEKKLRAIERAVERTKPKLKRMLGTGMERDVLLQFYNKIRGIVEDE